MSKYITIVLLLISNSISAQITFNYPYHIGTKWTYETVTQNLPYQVGFVNFEIIDTTRIQDTLAFVIESSSSTGFPTEYMYHEEGKVYFWDQDLEQFQLNFDFNTDMNYSTPWSGQCHTGEGTAIVNIDSVSQEVIAIDTFEIQHFRVENNGSYTEDMPVYVYKYIGADDGIKLQLGYGLCDPLTKITKLRCFESDSIDVNFVNYPCDTTFSLVSTHDIVELKNIEVYPNPSQGQINIKGIDENVDYWIYDINGELVQEGQILSNKPLFFDRAGVYFLKFKYKNNLHTKKIVIVK